MTQTVILPTPEVDWASFRYGAYVSGGWRNRAMMHILEPPHRPGRMRWTRDGEVPVETESICAHRLADLDEVPYDLAWEDAAPWEVRRCGKCENIAWNRAVRKAEGGET